MKQPLIRFPEYVDSWKEYTLNQFLTINTEKNKENEFGVDDVLSVSGEFGVVNQIELQGRSFAGESLNNYRITRPNNIIYTKSPLKSSPYGIIKYNSDIEGIVSVLYAVYDCKNVNGKFIEYYFANDYRLNKYLKPLVNMGPKHTMGISDEKAISDIVIFPTLSEQDKIVNFLETLEKKIKTQTCIVEALEIQKRSIMQKLFSGELRFKKDNGVDYEAWETVPFSEIASLSKEKFNPNTTDCRKCIELEHINQGIGSINGYIDSTEQSSTKNVFHKNSVLFGKLRPYLKKYWLAEWEGVCSSEIWVLTALKVTPEFLYCLVHTEDFLSVANMSAGTKMPRADWKLVSATKFTIPCKEEQQKIAAFLSTLDKQINNERLLIEDFKSLKNALLQQMFV